MQTQTIELRLSGPEELRDLWLDNLSDGGLFVPGSFPVSAGTDVLVRVIVEKVGPEAHAATTVLGGTVVWRRLPSRDPNAAATLRPGVGIAFHSDMRPRALFLERISRGVTTEGRGAVRYPARMPGEVRILVEERPLSSHVVDVGVRGARLEVTEAAYCEPGQRIELSVALPRSGEVNLAPLVGHVAWRSVSREGRTSLGVRLDLETKEERLHWAKIVTRARESLDEHPLRGGGSGRKVG